MRPLVYAMASLSTALSVAHAQYATVTGRVVLRDDGQPLGFTTISVLSQGTQRLASDSGTFVLRNLPPGEVRLRFRRIGFAPSDTTFTIAANDTARIRIEMTRLAIPLPEVVVNGTCTDRTPFENRPAFLTQLLDQVKQNAERMRLLAIERPFVIRTVAVGGFRDWSNNIIGKPVVDSIERGPLSTKPYAPRGVVYRGTEGRFKGAWIILLPELSDLADTAFTNNHCLWYAGQERFGADSVIRVDFEPVPWLDKELDLTGSIYLRVDGYQLVGLYTKLNRIPPGNRVLAEYFVHARFREIVSGVPVLSEWELTNVMRNNRPRFVQTGTVIGLKWLDSLVAKPDSGRRPTR
jgi:hypothetical protein